MKINTHSEGVFSPILKIALLVFISASLSASATDSLPRNWGPGRSAANRNNSRITQGYLDAAAFQTQAPPVRVVAPRTPPRQLSAEEIAAAKAATKLKTEHAAAAALKFNQDQASSGDAFGQLRMGERYRDGVGVDKDLLKAREMFQKAAAQGNQAATDALKKLPPQ